MTANGIRVFNYLKENYGKPVTAQQVAADLGISLSAVTGTVNGLVKDTKHPAYAVRTPVDVVGEDGKTATIKYIALTEDGMAFNPEAAE